MDAFKDISFDVRQLISINEKLHSTVLRGRALNEDELHIVRGCAKELLDLTKRANSTYHQAVKRPVHQPVVISSDNAVG